MLLVFVGLLFIWAIIVVINKNFETSKLAGLLLIYLIISFISQSYLVFQTFRLIIKGYKYMYNNINRKYKQATNTQKKLLLAIMYSEKVL